MIVTLPANDREDAPRGQLPDNLDAARPRNSGEGDA